METITELNRYLTVLFFGIKIRLNIIVKMENCNMFEIFIVDKIAIVVDMRLEYSMQFLKTG